MSDKVFFSLPCKPGIKLRLSKDKLTFWGEYYGRNVLTAKKVAQIGFDLCENACSASRSNIAAKFKELTDITLDEQTIAASKYAATETKVFGIIDENTAVYSLGVFLRDLLISTGRSDARLRAILDKACEGYSFTRYADFRELREDLAIYLKSEVDEELYGVVITSDKPLPEPIFRRNLTQEKPKVQAEEEPCFVPYSRAQSIRHSIAKKLTFSRVQMILAAFFILFSSVSIPITSASQAHGVPTFSQNERLN